MQLQIVLFASDWGSGRGGINAFNRDFAIGLAQVGQPQIKVFCAVPRPTGEAIASAESSGVSLIPVEPDAHGLPAPDAGGAAAKWLQDNCGSDQVDVWVGHDIKTGFVALKAAEDLGGSAALIHHMRYLSYENISGGHGVAAGDKDRNQRELFSQGGAVFGVGTELQQSARELSGRDANLLVPGFPQEFKINDASDSQLRVVVAGRFDLESEPLKQSRLAAEALGAAVFKSANLLPALEYPELVIMGVDAGRIEEGELEKIASERARRRIAVVPTPFDSSGREVVKQLARSNLAILPSIREGFGLVGWEAIGCEVPLVLGDATGIKRFIDDQLGGAGTGCFSSVHISGMDHEADVEAMADAVIKVAKNIPKARRDAQSLRNQLKSQLGCNWGTAATDFLRALARQGLSVPLEKELAGSRANAATPTAPVDARSRVRDRYPRCAELDLSAGQGSASGLLNLIVELRFGATEIEVDGVGVVIGIRRATLEVKPTHGRIRGERLGDRPERTPGISARAGGIWEITSAAGDEVLAGKVLGDEALCLIESPPNTPADASVEVLAAKTDVACTFAEIDAEEIDITTKKVLGVFLKSAVFDSRSGHVVLSSAYVGPDNDAK
ncbi:glycosyltransferase family 4 protein [Altererythrobacter sp. SALINAS58]|uniref:glycosyltransferase n=1 Tax=Alteripontixanthobacter muriae TaxID=2705546 RepID=UPI001575DE4B|nr:glycosyltransferase [Alteripontixanthobacter muriae]NTZ43616.1 glycosyltransferase family 4 protein [Alteripontixanthobacter muriae]